MSRQIALDTIWLEPTLSIVVYGVNIFGDALRDILGPRLRGGAVRYGVRAEYLLNCILSV